MIYKLILGDWSGDGHGCSKDVFFDCNYDIHVIRQAYKDSCQKLGITFNYISDYTGLNIGYDYNNPRLIWTEYCNYTITDFAFEILKKENCFSNIEYEKDEESGLYYIPDMEDCAKLIMNFIALSMPKDFSYNVVDMDYEPINGLWNKELNVQFGYGLFY